MVTPWLLTLILFSQRSAYCKVVVYDMLTVTSSDCGINPIQTWLSTNKSEMQLFFRNLLRERNI